MVWNGRGADEVLARPTKGQPLRLTHDFALWIEERFDRKNGVYARIGRWDPLRKVSYGKLSGATMEGASADARGNVVFLKYLPKRGRREAFLRSIDGRLEALPYVMGTPILLTGGEIVAPEVVGTEVDGFGGMITRTRLVRLVGKPGARRWEGLPVIFPP